MPLLVDIWHTPAPPAFSFDTHLPLERLHLRKGLAFIMLLISLTRGFIFIFTLISMSLQLIRMQYRQMTLYSMLVRPFKKAGVVWHRSFSHVVLENKQCRTDVDSQLEVYVSTIYDMINRFLNRKPKLFFKVFLFNKKKIEKTLMDVLNF